MSEQEYVVEIEGLWTRFGTHIVHQGIDLKVNRGEVLGLVGGSGSGKTTLLRQILGLETPYRGSVKVFGRSLQTADLSELQNTRNRWGVLFQEGALFSALTVFDNVALPMRELRVLPKAVIHDLVMHKLEMVGIEAITPNGWTGDIGFETNKFVTRKGYSTIKEIGGHGIGRVFHADPFVPAFGKSLARRCRVAKSKVIPSPAPHDRPQ